MGKSLARKRKRKFQGNQFTKSIETDNVEKINLNTASSSKLETSALLDDELQSQSVSGNRIIDLVILFNIFSSISCPECFNLGLDLNEDSRYGLCSHFSLKCKNCNFCKGFASSNKIKNEPEVNKRFIYGMRQIGKGFTAAFKFCSTMNLPKLAKTTYEKHESKILKAVTEVAENSMIKAASEIIEKIKCDKCGVSVDGTWQRRGHTSKNGCVAAISVDTGKVLDLEVMSSYCRTCKDINKKPNATLSESLKADHVCQCNFEGSAGKMETVGASRIFQRSVMKRKLKYTKYYGDGDSKGFISVQNTYGDNSVEKLECIGHVQKRVGSRLRKLKSKTKGISGKGKLTDVFIDRLQNYYGIAVRANVGNLQSMQQNVIAALFHCASNTKKPMHGQCPIGNDSWCYYQRALAQGKTRVKEKYSGLPNDVLNIIKPVYLELCSSDLLKKCLHGKTQNANECFNGVVWQRVPKTVFVSLKTVKLGAYDAVIQFNEGYQGSLKVLNALNINNAGYFTLKGYKQLDDARISSSKCHSTPVACNRRKILKAINKKRITVVNNTDGELYKSGAF